jgi:hypothetical protein
MSAYTYRVPQVQQMEELKAALSHNVFLYIDLDTLPGALQVRKR